MKLIIAPHEVNEERIAAIESQLNRPSCRLSTATPEEAAKCDCIIVDCYGKLSSAYRYGNIAYIGGGFGVGIHNLNEAAVYDIPVIFGPHYHKFKEARDLIKCKGGFSFSNKEEFDAIIEPIVNDKNFANNNTAKTPELCKGESRCHSNYLRRHSRPIAAVAMGLNQL